MIETYTLTIEKPISIDFDELVDKVLEEIDIYIDNIFSDIFYFRVCEEECPNYNEITREITKKVAKKLLENIDK